MVDTERLATEARRVLLSNDRGGYTVPAPHLYPHQWAWDSAFAAIGWLHIDPDRAVQELETLMTGQWDDGRIPHIQFHVPTTDYFPGPEVWGLDHSSAITQPPVWASAARRLLHQGASPERIEALLPKIERSHEFFYAQRDPLGWGLVAVAHPWESGRDNCPAWDEPLKAVDPTKSGPLRRVDTSKVSDPSMRPTDHDYRCYLSLARNMGAARVCHA